MSLKATVHRVTLEVADIDYGVYGSHNLTLARHPSETEERLMLRVLAFAMHANERLEFGRGLSAEDEPDLWLRDDTGLIERWIELGLPEEKRLRRAAGRARTVELIAYGGRGVDVWWGRNRDALQRIANLRVRAMAADETKALAALAARNMQLHCTIQDGGILIGDAEHGVSLTPQTLYSGAGLVP